MDGYGVVATQIGVSVDSASRFRDLFRTDRGLTHTTAASDVYRLFGKVFSREGIYDVEIFNKVLNDAIPKKCCIELMILKDLKSRPGKRYGVFRWASGTLYHYSLTPQMGEGLAAAALVVS